MNRIKTWLQAALCAAALAALAAPATAQKPRAKPPGKAKVSKRAKRPAKRAAKRATKPRVKEYDFLGDELEGEIGMPDGTDMVGRVAATHANLIRVRTSFLREIGKAAEDM